jgi:hypothetical protein
MLASLETGIFWDRIFLQREKVQEMVFPSLGLKKCFLEPPPPLPPSLNGGLVKFQPS